jgi:hypothetical protein
MVSAIGNPPASLNVGGYYKAKHPSCEGCFRFHQSSSLGCFVAARVAGNRPDYQIPFVPIIQEGEQPFVIMVDLHKKYNWVLEPRSYDSIETLTKALKPGIIDPAIKMHYELRLIKAKEQIIYPLQDFFDKD